MRNDECEVVLMGDRRDACPTLTAPTSRIPEAHGGWRSGYLFGLRPPGHGLWDSAYGVWRSNPRRDAGLTRRPGSFPTGHSEPPDRTRPRENPAPRQPIW